jgi:hypothetical protein
MGPVRAAAVIPPAELCAAASPRVRPAPLSMVERAQGVPRTPAWVQQASATAREFAAAQQAILGGSASSKAPGHGSLRLAFAESECRILVYVSPSPNQANDLARPTLEPESSR